ncbi:hypothetical protein BpHYR1_040975 [Brachionus plicatilis]|uniref:Uncharacterized protein n=1 Tax=Brachionus plicatilis TaxID=10195 RepID=A0A3M7SE01_BRAPC|nr:hypothetical protein BpHYR1_040975 [Brachionus plicatilis]
MVVGSLAIAQIGGLLLCPICGRVLRPAQLKISTNLFDVISLFEKTLVRVVFLQQIEQQIKAILDYDPAVQNTSFAFNYFHDAVKAALKSDYLLNVGICLCQLVQNEDGIVANDLSTVVQQVDQSRYTSGYLQHLFFQLFALVHHKLIDQLH